MDANNNNRLYLNFANTNTNDRLASNDRAYPTTPSTFPQPVFPPTSGQQQHSNLQPQAQPYGGGGGYAPQGYFAQAQYPAQQYPPQPAQDYSAAQNATYQPRSNTPGNDPNGGLAHQFSHQNLGGAARGGVPYAARGPSPSQRPRTAGATGQQPNYSNNYMNVPMPAASAPAQVIEFQQAPERNPDRYGTHANSNQKKCSQLAADFFKDSVKRARERNQR